MAELMTEQDVFHFEEDCPNFNNLAHENGFTFWYASELMKMLGYKSYTSFRNAVNKAMTACMTLQIPVNDNFYEESREYDGKKIIDFKLSRFACYLTVMNGDVSKPQVAKAQAFFATTAEAFRRYVDEAEAVERVLIRDEVSEHEKSLSGTAKNIGVDQYGLFQNAGYRGLYNMNINQLKKYKGIEQKRTPLDFMGKEELAANLFRITQTEAKLRNEKIQGQKPAEFAAHDVGRKVRQAMMEISGVTPESLPAGEDIKKIKSDLKYSHREFSKLDNNNKKKEKKK